MDPAGDDIETLAGVIEGLCAERDGWRYRYESMVFRLLHDGRASFGDESIPAECRAHALRTGHEIPDTVKEEPMAETRIIVVRESLRDSIIKDVVSLLMIALMVVPGWLVGSSALQWAGVALLVAVVLARALQPRTLTPQEAKAEIERLIAEGR